MNCHLWNTWNLRETEQCAPRCRAEKGSPCSHLSTVRQIQERVDWSISCSQGEKAQVTAQLSVSVLQRPTCWRFGPQPEALVNSDRTLGGESRGKKLGYWEDALERTTGASSSCLFLLPSCPETIRSLSPGILPDTTTGLTWTTASESTSQT